MIITFVPNEVIFGRFYAQIQHGSEVVLLVVMRLDPEKRYGMRIGSTRWALYPAES
jgi:hypothetical protein